MSFVKNGIIVLRILSINKGDYRLRKFPTPIDNFKEENCPFCEKRNGCSKDGKELFYCLLEKVSELPRRKQ
jgi:hypothetical protein